MLFKICVNNNRQYLLGQKNIFKAEVPMYNSILVQKCEALQNLETNLGDLAFPEINNNRI